VEVLRDAAWSYSMLKQLPVALKIYDRVLDITPNDPDVMAAKAGIYQTQGNLQEAARFLPEINCQTSPWYAFQAKIFQLRLERNYGEAVRLLQVRLAQFHYGDQVDKVIDQVRLALMQRLAGDTAGAKVTAEQACNTLERLYRDQPAPDNWWSANILSQAYAVMEKKDFALKLAERAIVLFPRTKDAMMGPRCEENLALIQTIFGEKNRAISTLTQLLQTPFDSWFYPSVVTPALLRLDPLWDPLRADPAFQKLCEEKQPPATP